jgi:hypothetical protein
MKTSRLKDEPLRLRLVVEQAAAGAGGHRARRREGEQLLKQLGNDLLFLILRRCLVPTKVQLDHLRQAWVQTLGEAHLFHGQ